MGGSYNYLGLRTKDIERLRRILSRPVPIYGYLDIVHGQEVWVTVYSTYTPDAEPSVRPGISTSDLYRDGTGQVGVRHEREHEGQETEVNQALNIRADVPWEDDAEPGTRRGREG